MNRNLFTTAICTLAGAMIASADVPSLINYQGRLTDSGGAPVTGSKNFDISIYDAATGGNLLYSETIGAVTLDSNGVYNFQFGGSGTSNTQVTEAIGTTAGSTLTYTKTLSNTPVVANSITVTDGTNSWSQSVGNPGAVATATATTISGFVIGATITSAGSGYTSAPAVTITGNGSGAAATATISGGTVTGITITSAGSGYTGGATITIAPPVIPFRVDYSGGAITATYSSSPAAGSAITATYRYGTSGIIGALSSGAGHWLAVSVAGVEQASRQRVLAAPFALRADTATNVKNVSDSALAVGTKVLENRIDGLLQLEASRIISGTGPSLVSNGKVERFGAATPSGQYGTLRSTNSNLQSLGIDINEKIMLGSTTAESITYDVNDLVKFAHLSHNGIGARTITTTMYYNDGTSHSNTEERWINDGAGQFRSANPFPEKAVTQISFSGIYNNTAQMYYRSLSPIFVDLNMQNVLQGPSRISVAPYVELSEGYSLSCEFYGSNGSLVYSGAQSSFDVPQDQNVARIKIFITPATTSSLLDGGCLRGVYFYSY